LVAEQHISNDHAPRRFNECIKDPLHPNGFLSPGKQVIWPKALRKARAPCRKLEPDDVSIAILSSPARHLEE
jgi:hypothetical protein